MKAADQLARNEHLSARLQQMLPEGADLQNEAAGFRNLGQFVAAVNVSKNLDVPFDELKAEMLGPSDGSLGRAIQALKSDLAPETVQAEAKKAKQEAKQEIKRAKGEAKLAEKQAKAQNRHQTAEQ
jgi:Skp family chaperone for outer membrane proteins